MSGKADDWKIQKQFFKNSNRKWSWLCPFLFLYTYHQFHKDKQHLLFGVEMGHFEEHQRQRLAFFGVLNRVWSGGGFYGRAGLHVMLFVVQKSIEKKQEFVSLNFHLLKVNLCQKLLFFHQYDDTFFIELRAEYIKIASSEHGDNMLCTQIVFWFDIQNNLCTQHVLPNQILNHFIIKMMPNFWQLNINPKLKI